MHNQDQHMAVISKGDAVKRDIDKNKQKKQIQQAWPRTRPSCSAVQQDRHEPEEQEAARADIVNMRVAPGCKGASQQPGVVGLTALPSLNSPVGS
jgi:hypothetical protein